MRLVVRPSGPLRGSVRVPGDKSIAHRWLILAVTADGPSEIDGLPMSDDVRSTATCLLRLAGPQAGLEAWLQGDVGSVRIEGRSFDGLHQPEWPLDCGNSGTTMRLLAGVLAGRPFESVLVGDESLSRRPMERVAEPLRRMGAEVDTTDGHSPLTIRGGNLHGIEYRLTIPSAQVKGAVLLAGLQADGETAVIEAGPTRDHTERALRALHAPLRGRERAPGEPPRRSDRGVHKLTAFQHRGFRGRVPGDLSSAAFLLAGAALLHGSHVKILDVGLNPTRMAFPGWLREAGAAVQGEAGEESMREPLGSLESAPGDARPLRVPPEYLSTVIDEVPALAALACHLPGESRFEGAGELRVKESDRLEGLVLGIRALGGEAEVQGDDLVVGGGGLRGGEADSQGDHRLAMALAVAALGAQAQSVIHGAEAAAVSFPGFATTLRSLGADLEVLEG